MESGSSGSFQSSSGGVGGVGGGGGGGDEEYDSSRGGESISSFLNSQQQLFLSHHQPKNPFFHPSSDHHHSQNLDASLFLQNANFQQQYNNDQMGWSRGFVRSSESNYGNFGNFSSTASGASSLPSSSSQSLIGAQGGRMINQAQAQESLLHSGGGSGSGGGGDEELNNATTAANQPPAPPQNVGAAKGTNPKKRTRASRRAPTTVLTTDTTNFRQMVQEFTGIPAAPFSSNPGGSAFSRRLDLFSSSSSMRGGHQLDPLSSFYPLRPSAQKITPPSSLLGPPQSSSSPPSSLFMMNAIGNPNNNNASIPNNTLGLPQHFRQPHPHQNILSMQNQLLNFQPLVQSSLSPSIFSSATRPHHQGSSSMNIPPSLDELGSFLNQQRSSEEGETQASWRDDQGGRNVNNEGQEGQHQQLVGSFDGNVTQHESNINSGFKLNSSSVSSDFNPEKALENASSSGGVEFTNYK